MSTATQTDSRRFDRSSDVSPEQLLDHLLLFEPVPAPFISLYLDARTNETGQRTFLPFVRKQLTEKGRTYAVDSTERASFEEDFVRIVRYLEDEIEPSVQGLAIFACSAANDYFQAGQFHAPFQRNQLFVLERPQVYPLARLIERYRHYAVVLADTNRAQIFVFSAGETVQKDEIENVKTKHAKVGGWSQARYQRHEENYHLHHTKEVVEHLERIVVDEQINHIILAGDEDVVIPLLREQMSKDLSDKVIDTLSLSIDTPEHELLQESLKAFHAKDSLTDMQNVEKFLGEFRGDNLAVAGVPDTLAALSNGQVEELIIASSSGKLKYDEDEVKQVLDAYQAIAAGPEVLNEKSIADELVRRARQLSSARVTFIEDATRLEQVGGVGALLRYRISDDSAAPYNQTDGPSRSEALVQKA
jgi:peptide subunit release factor 1 (eRF1)